jgi:NTP pyrophosphatase (non-canonical NTP hydrolase)
MTKENNMPGDINAITDHDVEIFRLQVKEGYTNGSNIMDEYQRIATKTAIYPGTKGPFGLAYVGLKLNGEAGEFAEHVGKAFRDDMFGSQWNHGETPTPLTPERKEALIKEVGDVLWYLSAACNELGISLSEAALTNLKKLNDRTKRNKLSGSGDNR